MDANLKYGLEKWRKFGPIQSVGLFDISECYCARELVSAANISGFLSKKNCFFFCAKNEIIG